MRIPSTRYLAQAWEEDLLREDSADGRSSAKMHPKNTEQVTSCPFCEMPRWTSRFLF